ncbi:MAG TPA: autotransporter domain-containing protein, partial [Steroidobacteraceae bacterium]|nr:autotransporter domain-containing protein [Steroidobacteraceae bacterium]
SQMIANAGADFSVKDSDAQPGEYVDLNGSASGGPPNSQPTYQWTLGDAVLGSSATLTHVRLPDGNNTVTLTVTFGSELSTSDTVQINVGGVQLPVANAGPDETITDTDDVPGKTITLDASNSSTPIGTITAYEWAQIDGQVTRPLGTGPTVTFDAQPGSTRVRLTITNSFGQVASAEKIVTLTEPMGPTANAGPDRIVHDSDHQAGEPIALDGSASSTASGTITSYEWSLVTQEGTQALGSGAKLTASLPNGVNTVQLVVTNSNAMSASDTVQITVMAMSTRTQLAELPNLTPNQRKMAAALDDLCSRVVDDNGAAINTATSSSKRVKVSQADRDDLVNRCRGLVFSNSAANQAEALKQLGADDFAAARTQATLFSTYQYTGVMDRLAALRGGAHGVSIAGLNLSIDGDVVPLAQMRSMVRHFLGGGASSDADSMDEPGGLLGDKLGLWFRGNYSFGKKDADTSSPRFDADQWVMLAGVDYRLSDHAVLGTAFSYANSSIKFDPTDPGGLDTKAWTASVYGSFYTAKSFYLDLTANVTNSNYDADRNITYVDGSGLVQADARGSTGGLTYSGGLSGGYDFVHGGLTISPNLGAFYINATIDSFAETGAGGLNLLYDDQNFRSLTGTAGLRMSYAWKRSWGVLLPHLRADFVQEFADETDVFAVRFAADPDVDNAPPILVETKNPDNSYWRLAGGFSFQLAHGLSGYLEYQRLQSFQSLAFSDVSGGLRFQRSF